MSKRPVALIIMDGFGYNPDAYGNAIRAAKKPNLEKYLKGPHTLIGQAVWMLVCRTVRWAIRKSDTPISVRAESSIRCW